MVFVVSIHQEMSQQTNQSQREQDRLDMQDILIKALIGKHNHAALEHPGRILDIGTGTGSWAEDIGECLQNL